MKVLHFIIIFLTLTSYIYSDHGPSNIGSQNNQTILTEKNHLLIQHITTYFEFETISKTHLKEMVIDENKPFSHIDQLKSQSLHKLYLSYGILSWFSLSTSTGYYQASDLREGLLDKNQDYFLIESGTIHGFSDLAFTSSFHIYNYNNLDFISSLSISIPTGTTIDNEKKVSLNSLNNPNFHIIGGGSAGTSEASEQVFIPDPSLQPSTNSYSYSISLGASYLNFYYFTITYTYYQKDKDQYKIGDLLNINQSFLIDIRQYKDWLFNMQFEITMQHQWQNSILTEKIQNSGGNQAFISTLLQIKNNDFSAFFGPIFPILNRLNTPQVQKKIGFKFGLSYLLHFTSH